MPLTHEKALDLSSFVAVRVTALSAIFTSARLFASGKSGAAGKQTIKRWR